MSCNVCHNAIPAMDPVIKCLSCESMFDYKCAGISSQRARAIIDPAKDDHYLCTNCKATIPQLRRDFAGLKQELEDLKALMSAQSQPSGSSAPNSQQGPTSPAPGLSDLQTQVTLLTQKFDEFAKKLDVQSIVKEAVAASANIMAQTVASVAAKAACQAVFEATRENEELKAKKLNAVVFGLKKDEEKDDKELVREMAAKVNITEDQITKIFRAGPESDERPQLVKVHFANMDAKQAFLEGGRMKKFGNNVHIRRDLTFAERQARREKVSSEFNVNTESFEPVFDVSVGAPTGAGVDLGGGGPYGGPPMGPPPRGRGLMRGYQGRGQSGGRRQFPVGPPSWGHWNFH